MGTHKFLSLSMIKTHLGFINKGFSEVFTWKTMLRLASYLLVLACEYVFLLLGFIFRYILRLYAADSSKKKDSEFEADHWQQDDHQVALVSEPEEENHEFIFGFRFQNSGTECSVMRETEHSISRENSQNYNTSKYHQFNPTNDYRGFIEEPENISFSFQELFVSPNDHNFWEFDSNAKTEESVFQGSSWNSETSKYQLASTDDFKGFVEDPEVTFRLQDFSLGLNDFSIAENGNHDSGEFDSKGKNSITSGKTEESLFQSNSPNQKTREHQFVSHKDFRGFIDRPEVIQDFLMSPNGFQLVDNANQDSDEFNSEAEGSVTQEQGIFSSDCHFQGKKKTSRLEINHLGEESISQDVGLSSRNQFWCFNFEPQASFSSEEMDSITSDYFANSFVDEETENPELEFAEENPNPAEISFLESRVSCIADDEYIELEPDFQDSDKSGRESFQETEKEGKSEEAKSHERSWDYDCEDDSSDDDLFDDVLLKHKESVEQMKAEMKNAKSKGTLPTILEESESPKLVEDLKPLMRIDEKIEHKDRLEEIQMVYKGYAEKMRKLDVLNYQTLHGISFLQLKDQIHQGSAQKSSVNSAIKSLLLPNPLQIKLRRIYADPTLKSITDLHKNLELVYVGQACLSWEILHWQCRKAMEIFENECEGNTSSYNHVAGEFQQFQVLLERFVENEPFQGPRIQNYAKNRCDIRSILQVPVIKDDSLKDKKDSTVWEDYEVSAAMLTQIIDESMRVFWEFLEADKDEANLILKGIHSTAFYVVDLQDPSDSEFLMDIKTTLQKKEKRLKDLLRSGNCLVKKFQKHQESRLRGALLFARVELKLVSRVLNMSRLTTDQLVWCQKKLNKISIVNRKIQIEPSFLLFPF